MKKKNYYHPKDTDFTHSTLHNMAALKHAGHYKKTKLIYNTSEVVYKSCFVNVSRFIRGLGLGLGE